MHILRLVSAALIVLAVATTAQAKRVALVIGNSAYQAAEPLANPANDARAMSTKLRGLGFETVEGFDLDHDGMRDVLRNFARSARGAEIATVFYAGHGISVDGTNYLVPVDAKLNDANGWQYQVYSLDKVLNTLKHSAGASLIFIDACRDNPMAATLARSMGKTNFRSAASRGLARVSPKKTGKGMIIAFATANGQTASDGEGANSPFTTALLNNLGRPNVDISGVMSMVTGDVLAMTNDVQRPWVETSLTGTVYLNQVAVETSPPATEESSVATAAPLAAGMSSDIEKVMFEAAQTSGDIADYRAYLDMFPNGMLAQMARNAIQRKEREAAQVVAVAAPTVAPTIQPQVAAPNRALTTNYVGPLQLPVTDALRYTISNAMTEHEMALTHNQKRQVQGRLNALGIPVGSEDGNWGNNTRAGIVQWQNRNGLPGTSFLNAVQYQLLIANSEMQYRTYMASRPTQHYSGGGKSGGGKTLTGSSIGDVAAGAIGGIILCKAFC